MSVVTTCFLFEHILDGNGNDQSKLDDILDEVLCVVAALIENKQEQKLLLSVADEE